SEWVRASGAVAPPRARSVPGAPLTLPPVPAPTAAAAAEYYPPVYWLSLANMPDKSEFPGTGHGGNGINPNIKSQPQFLREFKTDGCFHFHAVGTKPTRTFPEAFTKFTSPPAP